jgi:hypothetical protein
MMKKTRRLREQPNRGFKKKSLFESAKELMESQTSQNNIESSPMTSLIPISLSEQKTLEEVNPQLLEKYNLENYTPFRKHLKNAMDDSVSSLASLIDWFSQQIKMLLDPQDKNYKKDDYPMAKRLSFAKDLVDMLSKLKDIERTYAGKPTSKIQHQHSFNASLTDLELEQKELELSSILGKSFTKREIKITETSMGGNGAQT